MTAQFQTHAAADAHRLATRREQWLPQMTNLTLAELQIDLDNIPTHLDYQARAVIATSFIDAAAERLTNLGAK